MNTKKRTKQNNKQMTTSSPLAILLSLGAVLPSSMALAGGTGGGYSGPRLAGESIPLELDQGIRVKDVKKAISVCLVEGDSKRGIVPAMAPLFQAMFPQVPRSQVRGTSLDLLSRIQAKKDGPKYFEFTSGVEIDHRDNQFVVNSARLWDSASYGSNAREVVKRFDELNGYYRAQGSQEPVLEFSLHGDAVVLNPEHSSTRNEKTVHIDLGRIVMMPSVQFESYSYSEVPGKQLGERADLSTVSKDAYYDEMEDSLLFGLKITIPADEGRRGHVRQAGDVSTLKKLARFGFFGGPVYKDLGVKIDTLSYAECLKSEIQRRAK